MRHLPPMVDMKREPRKPETVSPATPMDANPYPYGLCICLCQEELDKLNLEGEVSPGDMIHLFCLAKVTSVSKQDREGSDPETRIEMQITHIAAENEDDENEAQVATASDKIRTLYR